MKRLLASALRGILNHAIGEERTGQLLAEAPRAADVDPLSLAYKEMGILNSENASDQIKWLWTTFECEYGHLRSRNLGLPVASNGEPLPWYTYPVIEFLSQLDFSTKRVFEFGSGNSSKYWAKRASSITSVENDVAWHQIVAQDKDPNQAILLICDPELYATSILSSDTSFDVIIVDGINRFQCARTALQKLEQGGLIILDNSDWFPKTAGMLRESGLIQVDFTGFGPVNNYTWTTSLFLHREIQINPIADRLPGWGIGSLKDTASDDGPLDAPG